MANPDIYIHPSKGTIGFSGANTGTIQIRTAESGDLHFEGDQGSLLTITDDLSDSLFSVNDAAGMPVFEVFADDTIKAYRNNEAKLEIDPDNNRVRVRDNLLVSGDLTVSGDITSASASHEATSYTATTHVSGLSGYFGKVGIGSSSIDALTDSTVTRLQISHPDESFAVNLRAIGTNYIPNLALSSDRPSSDQEMGKIKWLNNGATPVAQIKAIRGSSDTVGHLNFQTCNAHAMQIWSDQRVQIASTQHVAPQATLVVSGDASITGELRTDNLHAGGIAGIGIAPSSHQLEVAGGSYNSNLKLKGNGAAVGIQFADSDNNTDGYIYAAGTNIGFLDAGTDWMVRCVNDQFISFATNGATEHMRITSAGNVGIGTTNPAELLTVSGANATVRINTPITAGSDTAAYTFGLNVAADLAGMRLDYTDRVASGLALFVHPAYGYPISITPSDGKDVFLNVMDGGGVGIGTSNSDGSRLRVNGDASITGELRAYNMLATHNSSIGSTSTAYGRLFVDATTNVNSAAALAVRGRDTSTDYLALNVLKLRCLVF